jgi:hypothetical protein
MTTQSPTRAPIRLLAMVCLVFGVVACGGPGTSEGSMHDADRQFAELMKRPNIDEAVARYDRMYTEIRRQLGAAFPSLGWEQTVAPRRSGCDAEFGAVDYGSVLDAVSTSLGNWVAHGNLPDADWPRAVSMVDGIVRTYDFTSGPISPVNRSGEHEADFYDAYKAELVFGTAVNTTMTFSTGCHLTAQAKQRGRPAARPTY